MTVTRTAFGITVITKAALITVWRKVLGSTFALSTTLGAVARRVEDITLTWLADVRVVQLFIVGTIKSRFALVAVDALSVVTAVLTHSTTFIESVDIKRFAKMVNLRVVLTLVRMSKTIARFAGERLKVFGLPPGFLYETGTASFTLSSASVVLTAAEQLVRVHRVSDIAGFSVTVAYTSTTNTDVSNRVEKAAGESKIIFGKRRPLAEQSFWSQKP